MNGGIWNHGCRQYFSQKIQIQYKVSRTINGPNRHINRNAKNAIDSLMNRLYTGVFTRPARLAAARKATLEDRSQRPTWPRDTTLEVQTRRRTGHALCRSPRPGLSSINKTHITAIFIIDGDSITPSYPAKMACAEVLGDPLLLSSRHAYEFVLASETNVQVGMQHNGTSP